MFICYVDESGDTGVLPDATSSIQPLFVLLGVIVSQSRLDPLTRDFLLWKRRFFPRLTGRTGHALDDIRVEIKGSDFRALIKSGSGDKRKFALTALDAFVALLESYEVRIVGRLWIKGIGTQFDGTAIYARSIQALCQSFNHHCEANGTRGWMILDSRNKSKDENVSHSIFTQKFRGSGDAYAHLLEMPTFGRSGNHAGLQIADLLSSALVFPIAAHTYCAGYVTNTTHIHPDYRHLKTSFAGRVRQLQYRYPEQGTPTWKGGIWVTDAIANRSGSQLFK